MRRLASLLLLAAACNGTESSQLDFPAGELQDFILRFNRGSITVRNPEEGEKADVCVVKVKESGGAETLGAAARFNVNATKKRLRLGQRRNEAELRLDVEVVLPAGTHLDLVLREGPIRVRGKFGRVSATTSAGDVAADLAQCAAATIKAAEGDVDLVLGSARIEGDATCETLAGNASLRIAPGFRGPVQLYSGSAEIDLGEAPVVEFLVDPDKKSARAFAGTPMTKEEVEKARKENRWPAGLWAKTQRGRASFRVG